MLLRRSAVFEEIRQILFPLSPESVTHKLKLLARVNWLQSVVPVFVICANFEFVAFQNFVNWAAYLRLDYLLVNVQISYKVLSQMRP